MNLWSVSGKHMKSTVKNNCMTLTTTVTIENVQWGFEPGELLSDMCKWKN